MERNSLQWLPNALSASRLATVPVLVLCVWLHARTGFLVALAVTLASDVVDGCVARVLRATSLRGAKLDSWGDGALYITVPAGVALLWPEVVAREWPWVVALVASYLVPVTLGFAKFRRLTRYHPIAAKAAAVAVAAAAGLLLLGGPGWPFHLAVILLMVSALEEIALTLMLPAWQANVGSFWHVWRARAPRTNTAA